MAGLIGAVAAIAATTPTEAAAPAPQSVQEALRAESYADLLKPIPNARALLAPGAEGEAAVETVQLVVVLHHRHHYRHRYYHHHHHHHDY